MAYNFNFINWIFIDKLQRSGIITYRLTSILHYHKIALLFKIL